MPPVSLFHSLLRSIFFVLGSSILRLTPTRANNPIGISIREVEYPKKGARPTAQTITATVVGMNFLTDNQMKTEKPIPTIEDIGNNVAVKPPTGESPSLL